MLDKIADYLNTTPQTVVITLVVLAVLFVIIWIKISMDEKKGIDSQEKADIRKIISNLVPDGEQYIAAYAHSKEVYGGARMRREVYHYYAIGFRKDQTDHLWVVPIGVERGKIVYTEPMCLNAQTVAYVGGRPAELVVHFPGSRDTCILSVDRSNTKLGKECQVNIQQPEEAKAYEEFAPAFQEQVNNAIGVDRKGRKLKK